MKMIATPAAVFASAYPAYVHNCLRNAACELSYSAPLPDVYSLQLYVDFGTEQPVAFEIHLLDTCTGLQEQIFPENYVIGQTPEGNWYGVFKYFATPVLTPTTFVIWLSASVDTPLGIEDRTFFSEMLMIEPCLPLMKIKSCQPEGATTTGFDVNGIYYGLPAPGTFLGNDLVRYFHIAWVRLGKVRELSNKGTFKSSLIKNFRTTIEKIYQLETELVPKWYKDELLAIYARGAVQINDGQIYLVSDLSFEALNDDDLTWKPYAQLKDTFRLFYGCDDSQCIEEIIPDSGSGSGSISGSGSESSSGSEPPVDPDRVLTLTYSSGRFTATIDSPMPVNIDVDDMTVQGYQLAGCSVLIEGDTIGSPVTIIAGASFAFQSNNGLTCSSLSYVISNTATVNGVLVSNGSVVVISGINVAIVIEPLGCNPYPC